MSNHFSLLERFFLDKCSYTQAFFIASILDLFIPSTSTLATKILHLISVKPMYDYVKDEFKKSFNDYYFKNIILKLIKPESEILISPIINLNLAIELYDSDKTYKNKIIEILSPEELVNTFKLYTKYKEETDIDKKKELYILIKQNNVLVTTLHNKYKVLINRYLSDWRRFYGILYFS